MGALNNKPRGFQLGKDPSSLQAQQQKLQGIIDRKGGKAPKAIQRLEKVNGALGAMPTQQQQAPQNPGFQNVTNSSNDYLQGVFGQLQGQGQFNPGSFQDTRQQATDVAMNEFNRLNQGRFSQEDAAFEEQMTAQGIDPTSEKFRNLNSERMLNRNSAIQGAQNNAFQMGQGEQAQAFGQASSKYQMPLQQLQAASPYYGYQAQSSENALDRQHQVGMQQGGFDFQKELAALQQKYSLQQIAATPRGGGGGGGLSFDQQMALQNNAIDKNYYNNLILSGVQAGNQPQRGGVAQGVAQGVGQGISAGITSGLVR